MNCVLWHRTGGRRQSVLCNFCHLNNICEREEISKFFFLWWCYVAFLGCAWGSSSWGQGCTEKWPQPPCRLSKATLLMFPSYYQRRGSIPSWTCFLWPYVMSLLQRNNTAWLLNTRLTEITFNSEARKSIRHQFEVMQVACAKACASGFEDNWFVIKGTESCSVHSTGLQIFARSDPSHKCAKWIS